MDSIPFLKTGHAQGPLASECKSRLRAQGEVILNNTQDFDWKLEDCQHVVVSVVKPAAESPRVPTWRSSETASAVFVWSGSSASSSFTVIYGPS